MRSSTHHRRPTNPSRDFRNSDALLRRRCPQTGSVGGNRSLTPAAWPRYAAISVCSIGHGAAYSRPPSLMGQCMRAVASFGFLAEPSSPWSMGIKFVSDTHHPRNTGCDLNSSISTPTPAILPARPVASPPIMLPLPFVRGEVPKGSRFRARLCGPVWACIVLWHPSVALYNRPPTAQSSFTASYALRPQVLILRSCWVDQLPLVLPGRSISRYGLR